MVLNTSESKEQEPAKDNASPFKMWDSYLKEDKDIFFGRDRESQLLYDKTFTSNLVLLYGASGTGKTSLIQCGLGNKFEDAEWLPIFIRKGDNIIKSISTTLRDAAKDPDKLRNNSIREKIHELFLEQFRPVFLVFDQFEELFIQGSTEEQESFFMLLPELMANNFQCKIIISIREDYLAYLDTYEDYVPGLFYNRQRLERMRKEQLEDVIAGTADKLDIQLGDVSEEDDRELIDQIIENVENDLGKVDLADLQVYLDQLYKKDQQRKKREKNLERKTRFDSDLVKKTGDLEDVLGGLLAQQLVSLEHQLEDQGATQKGIPKSVLAELVTTEGTKLNMPISNIQQILQEREHIAPEHVAYCIDYLIEIRILKDQKKNTGETVEIAHDRLANKIYSLIGGERQKEKEIVQEIQNGYNAYQKRGVLLSEEDLAYLHPYLENVVLSTEQRAYIRLSKRHARKKGMRQRMFALGVIAVLACSVILAIWQWNRSRQLSRANSLSAAALHAAAVDRTKAYNLAKQALEIVEDHQLAGTVLNDMLINSNIFPFYADVLKSDRIEKFSDMAVSDDKRFLAAGSLDGRILFYKLKSMDRGSRDTVYSAHNGLITDVDFTRTEDGKNVLLTSSRDGTVQVRYTEGDSLRFGKQFDHQKMPVFMFTHEDSILLSATAEYIMKWDFETALVTDIYCLSGVTSFEFVMTGSGRYLMVSTRDSTIRIKNINEPDEPDIEVRIPEGVIENMDIREVDLADTEWLLTAGLENGKMMIAELKSDFFIDPLAFKAGEVPFHNAHRDAIKDISIINQEGNRFTILSSSRDKTAKLWTYTDNQGEEADLITLQKSFLGHNDGLRAISHVGSGRKYTMFTGGEDRTIKKWIVQQYPFRELPADTNDFHGFTHSPEGKKILAVGKANQDNVGAFSLFHYGATFSGDFEIEDIQQPGDRRPQLSRAVFSATGDTLLFPYKDRRGDFIISVEETDSSWIRLPKNEKVLGIHQGPDGKKALLLDGAKLRLYDFELGVILDSVQHEYPADQAYFSPDGQLILVTAKGEEVTYWWYPGLRMKETESLSDHTDEVLSVAFSPYGRGFFLTGGKDNRFMLYQYRDLEKKNDLRPIRIGAFTRHTDNVNSVAFSADGKRFLSASEDGTLRIWNIEGLYEKNSWLSFWKSRAPDISKLQEEKSFINLGKPIVKAAFLADTAAEDGIRIITRDRDGTIQVWNTAFLESPEYFDSNIYPMEKTYADYSEEQ